jgi:hypothetical protein
VGECHSMKRSKRQRNHRSLVGGKTQTTPSATTTTSAEAIGTKPAKKLSGIEELTLEKIKQNADMDLSTLVNELTHELGYNQDRILQRLMELETNKKIKIQEKTPYKSFVSYATSPDSLWFWGALAATLLSLAVIDVTSGLALYLRYVFGGLVILFLPGYSLIQFLYAKKKELDELTRLALSIGLSLAIVPLIGLALNYTPFGIRLIPVAISLAFFTILFLVLALRMKHTYYKIAKDII